MSRSHDKETRESILKHIANGETARLACLMEGVSRQSYYRWLRSDPAYAKRASRAEAVRQAGLTGLVRAHAADDWRAAAWLLSKTAPEFADVKTPDEAARRAMMELMDRLAEVMEPGAFDELIRALGVVYGVSDESVPAIASGD